MGAEKDAEKGSQPSSLNSHMAITAGYVLLWTTLSASVIMLNKYILAYASFPFPIALTLSHMAFCSLLAALLIRIGVCDAPSMDSQQYIRNVVPIAALFSGTLWLGNAAYMYLSVSFIQMIKASMPVTVFSVGVFLGTEKYSHAIALNLVVVSIGVAAASYGEMAFVLIGVIFQASSIATESFRLALIQILLQQRGIKLNPITTLYYVAPACFAFLSIPFLFIEFPVMRADTDWELRPMLLLGSAAAAFALNLSVFMLIGRTSALTMNVAGVLKDWLLIGLSVAVYHSQVTPLQIGGYTVALAAVAAFNYQKVQAMKANAGQASAQQAGLKQAGGERDPLLQKTEGMDAPRIKDQV